jgi:hypothetical protein
MAADLTFEEQLALVEKLAQRLRSVASTSPATTTLYGAWKGKLPDDAAVDDAIREARTAWKKELEDIE